MSVIDDKVHSRPGNLMLVAVDETNCERNREGAALNTNLVGAFDDPHCADYLGHRHRRRPRRSARRCRDRRRPVARRRHQPRAVHRRHRVVARLPLKLRARHAVPVRVERLGAQLHRPAQRRELRGRGRDVNHRRPGRIGRLGLRAAVSARVGQQDGRSGGEKEDPLTERLWLHSTRPGC